MRRSCLLAAAAAAVLSAGCDRGPGDPVPGGDPSSPDGPQRWTLGEPELTVGVVAGEEPYQLHQVTAAVRLSDGRVAMANGGTHEIRVFGPDGAFLTAQGSQGDGPGEWQRPVDIHPLAGDTLAVVDGWTSRVGFVDARTGDFLGTADSARAADFHPPLLFHAGLILEGVSSERAGVLTPVVEALDATGTDGPYRVRVEPEGEVWVDEAPDRSSRRLRLMDLEGATRAVLELPEGFEPLEVGSDYVLGVRRDSLDVEYLELRPLSGRSELSLPAPGARGDRAVRPLPPHEDVAGSDVPWLRAAVMRTASAQEMFYAERFRYSSDPSLLATREGPLEMPEGVRAQILEANAGGWMGRFVQPETGVGCFLVYGRFRLPEGVQPGGVRCWGPGEEGEGGAPVEG